MAGKAVAVVAERLKLPRFEGTNGLGGMVAQGLNNSAAGIEQVVNAALSQRGMGTSGGGAVIPGDTGGSVVGTMGKILLANNFSRAGAAGIIGNAYRESGWNPGSIGSGGGGLFGFTSGAVSLSALQSYANKKGEPWTSVPLQMEFMLTGSGSGGLMSGAYGDLEAFLKSTSNIASATSRFMLEWERPLASSAALDIRTDAAQRAFQMGSWANGGIIQKLAKGGGLNFGANPVRGKVSWFSDSQTASGTSAATNKGLALNIDPGTDSGWNNSKTRKWLKDAQDFQVTIGSHKAIMPVIDLGPAGSTGRAIDVSQPGVKALGYTTSNFPTDAMGVARRIKSRGGGENGGGGNGGRGGRNGAEPPGPESYSPADIPKKILDMVEAHQGAIKLLDNEIMLAEHFASYNSSEAGASEGPLEVAKQLFLNQQLLTNLEGLKGWLKRGMRLKRTSAKGKKQLQALLTPLVGDESSVGRILDVKKRIDDLQHPEFAEVEQTEAQAFMLEYLKDQLLKANQRTGVSQAQYAVFRDFAGGFAGGGYIPQGKWGVVGESGPEVVGGPSTVAQMGGEGVSVIVNGDIINTPPGMQPVEVRGAKTIVQQGSRGYGRRPLGGAKGY